ncbi:MAG TPA: response regulator transcription factor [Geobacteraceae bacterium]|nr:response regulator transcription factor [Geobacteraceae bacterium]
MNIKVLLVDDHKIVREGLRSLLEKEGDITIVAEADNGRTAVQLANEALPDVVVMDIAMPEMNGIEATRRITAENPEIRVLALSMHSARRFVSEALSVGAKGYLLKDCAADELVRAIRTVAADKIYLSPDIADQIVKDYVKNLPDSAPAALSVLSTREKEVLQLIAEGRNTKEIAFTLNVSIKTIETHRQQIMKKLNLQSVAGLTRYAIREGLTPLE